MKIEIRADNSVHIEGYVNAVERDSNIINVPSVGRCVEQIRAGAFGQALSSGADVAILENHDTARKLGSTSQGNLKLCEDNIGLRASADITDADIAGKARRGELKGWSFGFICTDSEIEQRAGNVPRRIVKGMTLSEVSLIDGAYKPCYNGTLVEVRSEGNLMEYRSGVEEPIETIIEERAEEPDYSYYDALLQYHELRSNGKNYTKGKGGKFTGSTPGGGSGSGAGAPASASETYGIPKKSSVTKRLTDEELSGKIKSSGSEYIKPSVGGGTIDIRKRKTGYNRDSKGNLYIPYDQKANAFGKPEYHLPPKTYGRIRSAINTEYYSKHEGKKYSYHRASNKVYYFENHGYDDFNIYDVGD